MSQRLAVGPLPPGMTRADLTEIFSRFGGRDPFIANATHAYINVDADKACAAVAAGVEWRGRRLSCRVMVKGSTFSASHPLRRRR